MSLGVDATHSFFKQNKYLDPFKEIICVQTEKGVIGKHIKENFDNFKKNGSYMSTAVPSNWLI